MQVEDINWQEFESITKECIEIICGSGVEFICSGENCKINKRQFDVLFKYRNSLKDAKIAIECKHWNKKVGIGAVDAFTTKCLHCNIDSKFIISKKGFTKPAIEQAQKCNIELIELRNFQEDDFKDCFQNCILSVEINTHMQCPKIESNIIFNVDGLSYNGQAIPDIQSLLGGQIPRCNGIVSLILLDGTMSDLTNYVPSRVTNMENQGFSMRAGEVLNNGERRSVYEKTIECTGLKLHNNDLIVRMKNVKIVRVEIYDNTTTYKKIINIDYKSEIKKAGYLVAKSILKKSKHVLDMNGKLVINKTE